MPPPLRPLLNTQVKSTRKPLKLLKLRLRYPKSPLPPRPERKPSVGGVYLSRSFFNYLFFSHTAVKKGGGAIGIVPFISFHSLNVWEALRRMHFLLILFSLIFWVNVCMCVCVGGEGWIYWQQFPSFLTIFTVFTVFHSLEGRTWPLTRTLGKNYE